MSGRFVVMDDPVHTVVADSRDLLGRAVEELVGAAQTYRVAERAVSVAEGLARHVPPSAAALLSFALVLRIAKELAVRVISRRILREHHSRYSNTKKDD